MIKKALPGLIFLLFVVALILYSSAAYIVDETEQVIITQFGKPVGKAITDPGLHFKTPFVQDVNRFEKRIMEWDGDKSQVPTKDKRFIWVDSTARWRIIDPLLFFRSVQIVSKAHSRMDDILNSATNEVLSSLNLIESVRSSNREFQLGDDEFSTEYDVSDYQIEVGRHLIGERIKKIAESKVKKLGIELVDIRLRRINYVQEVREKVYDRMISERKRMAAHFRSQGEGEKMRIEGELQKTLKTITSNAYKQAEEIRGQADAQAAKIYADAYNADPEFYGFLKSLETYKTTVANGVDLILTTDNDYFKYFKTIKDYK